MQRFSSQTVGGISPQNFVFSRVNIFEMLYFSHFWQIESFFWCVVNTFQIWLNKMQLKVKNWHFNKLKLGLHNVMCDSFLNLLIAIIFSVHRWGKKCFEGLNSYIYVSVWNQLHLEKMSSADVNLLWIVARKLVLNWIYIFSLLIFHVSQGTLESYFGIGFIVRPVLGSVLFSVSLNPNNYDICSLSIKIISTQS